MAQHQPPPREPDAAAPAEQLCLALQRLEDELGLEPVRAERILDVLMRATGCSLSVALETVLEGCAARRRAHPDYWQVA